MLDVVASNGMKRQTIPVGYEPFEDTAVPCSIMTDEYPRVSIDCNIMRTAGVKDFCCRPGRGTGKIKTKPTASKSY